MTELSPAAQAVLDAAMQYEINPECYSREIAAAALRALNKFVRIDQPLGDTDADAVVFAAHQAIYGYITAIADELDGTQ
jgi:hypothetical protein